MGQYYMTVNLDKRQYLFPHKMGDGLKLLEFGLSSMGTMSGLAILLADGNGRGGGDLHSKHPLIGSWAGDRIVVAGDYADPGKWLEAEDDAVLEAVYREYIKDVYPDYRREYQQTEEEEGVRAAALQAINLFSFVGIKASGYKDISIDTLVALADDDYFRMEWEKRLEPDGWYRDEWAAEYREKRAAWTATSERPPLAAIDGKLYQ